MSVCCRDYYTRYVMARRNRRIDTVQFRGELFVTFRIDHARVHWLLAGANHLTREQFGHHLEIVSGLLVNTDPFLSSRFAISYPWPSVYFLMDRTAMSPSFLVSM